MYKNTPIHQVPNYSNNYVDIEGNIYLWQKSNFTIVKCNLFDDNRGYLFVGAFNDVKGKKYPLKAHTAVLTTFVGPCPPGMQARHLDDNSYNNHLSNLKWGTSQENQADKIKNKKHLVMPSERDRLISKVHLAGFSVKQLKLITGMSEPKIIQAIKFKNCRR